MLELAFRQCFRSISFLRNSEDTIHNRIGLLTKVNSISYVEQSSHALLSTEKYVGVPEFSRLSMNTRERINRVVSRSRYAYAASN